MGKVPIGSLKIQNELSHRLGLTLKVPNTKNDSKINMDSFKIRGPQTYNGLSKYLRILDGSNDSYKKKLDEVLCMISDTLRLGKKDSLYTNELDIQVKKWIEDQRFQVT